jgi:hypothetical protein
MRLESEELVHVDVPVPSEGPLANESYGNNDRLRTSEGTKVYK